MKRVLTEITNIFKIMLVGFIKLLTSILKKDEETTGSSKSTKYIETKKIEEKKEVKKINNDNIVLPDTESTKTNPDLDVILFTKEHIQEVIDKYLEDEYEIKVKKIEDKELLEELDKFNKEIHKKINKEIDTGWEIVNEDDLKKKVEYHVEEYFDEKKRLFEKPEVIIKRKEQEEALQKELSNIEPNITNKEEILDNNPKLKDITPYTLVTPIKKRIKLDNEIQKTKKQEAKIAEVTKEQKEDIIEETENKTMFMTPTTEEVPKLSLKDEVVEVVAASSIILASIAKEIITAPTNEKKKTEETINEEIINEIKEETIEEKKEEIIKEIENIEKVIEAEIDKEKKEQLKERKKELEITEQAIEKAVQKKEQVDEEVKQIKVDIRPLENETLEVIKDTQKEQMKVDFEDKNYDALEEEIDKTISKIENFILLNEKYLTEYQKHSLRMEQNKLEGIKNSIKTQKQADLRVEEIKLEEHILGVEIQGLKDAIKQKKIEEKLDLEEEKMKSYEDLDKQAKKDLPDIEKRLMKRKLKRASRIAAISSLAAIPFIHNPYFLFFTTGVFIKTSLLGWHSTLRHKEIINETDLEKIKNGRDALENSLDLLVDNMNHLDYLTEQSITRYPELQHDKEFTNYVTSLKSRLNKNYDKLIKKQYTIDRYLFKAKKDIKILKKENKKKPEK